MTVDLHNSRLIERFKVVEAEILASKQAQNQHLETIEAGILASKKNTRNKQTNTRSNFFTVNKDTRKKEIILVNCLFHLIINIFL